MDTLSKEKDKLRESLLEALRRAPGSSRNWRAEREEKEQELRSLMQELEFSEVEEEFVSDLVDCWEATERFRELGDVEG